MLTGQKSIAFKYCMSSPLHVYGMPAGISKYGEPDLRAKECKAVLPVIRLSYAELLPAKLC